MLTGILTGIVTMFVVWWTSACAWTWYALVGASVTSLSALAASAVMPRTSDG
jgi:hypothetical protein